MPNSLSQTEYLKAKVRIGSCKGPVSYRSDQQVFHHDDVPSKARKRKEDVAEWSKSRILSNERVWSQSTDPNVPICIRRTTQNQVRDRSGQYQYNYRAETLDALKTAIPLDRPTKFHVSSQLENVAGDLTTTMKSKDPLSRGALKRTQEMPIHPNLEEATPWNYSTVFPRPVYEECHATLTTKAATGCLHNRSKYLDVSKYSNPMQLTNQLQEKVRGRKAEGTFEWKKLINRDRSLDEPVDRRLLKNRFPAEKPKHFMTHQHSGVWEMNKAEGRLMWSDTASFEFESTGDTRFKHDPEAYCYAGPSIPNRGYTVRTVTR